MHCCRNKSPGITYFPKHSGKVAGTLVAIIALIAIGWLIACPIKGWNVGDKLGQYWEIVKKKFLEIPNDPIAIGVIGGVSGMVVGIMAARAIYVYEARKITNGYRPISQ